MQGHHCIKQWSKTQACVALSSGEAELYGIVKASTEGLGMRSAARELGRDTRIQVCTDSSAAKGAAMRTGCGRLKHVQISQFWVQERICSGDITVRKVPREVNTADLLTHHWVAKEGRSHLPRMGFEAVAVA